MGNLMQSAVNLANKSGSNIEIPDGKPIKSSNPLGKPAIGITGTLNGAKELTGKDPTKAGDAFVKIADTLGQGTSISSFLPKGPVTPSGAPVAGKANGKGDSLSDSLGTLMNQISDLASTAVKTVQLAVKEVTGMNFGSQSVNGSVETSKGTGR
jgi:hypothetical protein